VGSKGTRRAGLPLRTLVNLHRVPHRLANQVSFWRSAYVPHGWGSSTKAFAEAIQGVTDESEVSRSLYARAEAVYSAITLNHLSDPVMHQAQPIMKANLNKAYQRTFASQIAEQKLDESNTEVLKYFFIGFPFIMVTCRLSSDHELSDTRLHFSAAFAHPIKSGWG
jgi:hypothetical protein